MSWPLIQLQSTLLLINNVKYQRRQKSISCAKMGPSHKEQDLDKQDEETQILLIDKNIPVLSWKDLTVSIPVTCEGSTFRRARYNEKTILLDSISGHMAAGSLIALMGPSGAGKSTLLSLLSQRIKCDSSGSILLHGERISTEAARRIIGFVPQQDLAFEGLTAREHLSFMAELRLGKGWQNTQQWIGRVDDLLENLNLTGCSDVRIENLSGGERKRLALAVELLTRPIVLLCDEPCSGLDSSSALHIIQLLKQETERGATVMCSLHQPAPKLLRCFDRVLTLGQKGKSKLVEYAVDGAGGLKEAEADDNLENDKSSSDDNIEGRTFLKTEIPDAVYLQSNAKSTRTSENQLKEMNKLPWLRQMFLLLRRNWIASNRRSISSRLAAHLVCLVTGSFIALFYSGYRPDPPNQAVVQDLRGVLYLLSSEVMFTSAYSALGRLPGQLALLRRERGLYSLSAAYISDVLNLVPKAIFEPLLLLGCVFWSIQLESLRTFSSFTAIAFVLIYVSLVANAYGCLLFGILGSASLASEVATPLDLLLLLLSGMFIALPSLPSVLHMMRYLSAFYFCNDALATMQWAQVPNITCPMDEDLPCLRNGVEVLHRWGFSQPPEDWVLEPTNLGPLLGLVLSDLGGLTILGLIMHLGAYFGLRRQANKEAAY